MDGDEGGDLAQAVASLRAELLTAIEQGRSDDVQFGLGDVELTLQLVATKHGGAKIGWSVLGADGSYERANTHTVKLVLKPALRQADGSFTTDFRVASSSATAPTFGSRS